MSIGVSTASLYPLETEKALIKLGSLGVKKTELFLNSSIELEFYLDTMLRAKEDYGIDIVSFHPFSSPMETVFLFSKYQRRVQEMLDKYESYFEAMNKLGAKIFVLHGAINSSSCDDEYYIQQYSRLFELGKSYNIIVTQENISYCKSHSLELLRKMKNLLGENVAFTVDLKQAIRSQLCVFDIVDALKESIKHFHISDSGKKGDCLLAGEGDFNFSLLFEKAEKFGYEGDFIIELYRNNYDNYEQLSDNCDYLQGIYKQTVKF